MAKYANDEIARLVASGGVWTGQTAEQLRDARGAPLRVERQESSEVWIYKGHALNPQGTRIVVNDDRVENWS